MNHFTNKTGFNGIRSAPDWRFRAAKPPDARPFGSYFTILTQDAPNLAARLGVPRAKVAYAFEFRGDAGLHSLRGGRGEYVFYSPDDYMVIKDRQIGCGETGL